MGLFKDYVSQTRKPEGNLGKMMIKGINSGHAKMADWGISHLSVDPKQVVDFGSGFSSITWDQYQGKPWITVIATK